MKFFAQKKLTQHCPVCKWDSMKWKGKPNNFKYRYAWNITIVKLLYSILQINPAEMNLRAALS